MLHLTHISRLIEQVKVTETCQFPCYCKSYINPTCMDDAFEDAYYSAWYGGRLHLTLISNLSEHV